jgi:hypothetical protein
MLHTIDAELLVTAPGSTARIADGRVPGEDIISASVAERAGRDVAQGSITIDNADGAYTSGAPAIDVGDKLEFRVAWAGGGRSFAFGEAPFGAGGLGTGTWTVDPTLIVTDWTVSGARSVSTLTLDVEQFVFNRLRARTVNEYAALDAPIAGSADAHLDTVLRESVPDVDRSQLPTIAATVDYSIDKKRANKAVADLARLAHDATGESWILGAVDEALTMQSLSDLAPQWTADADRADFAGGFEHASDAGDLVNEVRAEGGVDPQNVDDEQTTHDTSTTVTDTTRLTTRISSRKPEHPRVEVYAIKNAGSDDNLRVRLQSDDGAGNPVAPGDTDSDLASQSQAVPDGYDGWLTFQLGEHILGPNDSPHLIVDATGSDGQTVGQNSSTGEPAYKVHFSKPVIVALSAARSETAYRAHDTTIADDNLRSFDAARNRARAELDRRSQPKLEYGPAGAASRRAHALSVADVITLEYDWLRAEGDYVATGIDHAYDGATLKTEVELKSVARFA